MKAVSTEAIAKAIGKSESQTRRILCAAESAGLVHRVGQRGGWSRTAAGIALITPLPTAPSDSPGGAEAGAAGGEA